MTADRERDQSQISRRRFVAATIVTGAAVAVPASAEAEAAKRKHKPKPKPKHKRPASTTHTADVAVVGAGFAGLTAARQVAAAGKSVIVLEARGRVGGRAYSRSIGAGASDVANMGATFVGPTQTHILTLMSDLGIGKFPTYSTGKLLWYENGKGTSYTGVVPPADDPVAVVQLGTVTLPAIDQMAQTVPLDAPWTAANAEEWDSMTADTWSEQNISTAAGRALFALAVEAVLSMEPRDVSFLYFLFYVHAAGSVEELVNNAGQGGAQDFRVSGGTQRMPIGSLIKTIAVYETPFWRDQGLNGQVTCTDLPVGATFDASPASGTPGVMLGFMDGDQARNLDDSSDRARATAAIRCYTAFFGRQAANPRMYLDQVWAREIWTGGCPVGIMPPGVMTEYGPALRAPWGRIHWAGTETATVWTGYMDGAVQSGKRAAAEVLAEL